MSADELRTEKKRSIVRSATMMLLNGEDLASTRDIIYERHGPLCTGWLDSVAQAIVDFVSSYQVIPKGLRYEVRQEFYEQVVNS